jgi:hypothetical protein
MHQCAPAIEPLTKATALGESVPDSWFAVARCNLELGKDQDALVALKAAAESGYTDDDGELQTDVLYQPLMAQA